MEITSYADLINAANLQAEPQRLLFVFARAGLPDDASEEQKEIFFAKTGGTLTPIMCVDMLPDEAADFAGLVEESSHMGGNWDIVFISSMSGQGGVLPESKDADMPLQVMVESIKSGIIDNYLTFDRGGNPVQLG